MRTKILFIVNVDWFFISHRLPIALAAMKEGYEVHVACGFTGVQNRLNQLGVITHEIPIQRSGTSLRGELRTFRSIYNTIKEVNPSIVHSITIKPALYGGTAARLLKVNAKVASISGLGYLFIGNELKIRTLRMLASSIYRFSLSGKNTRVIFQNPTDRDLFVTRKIVKDNQVIMIKGSGVNLDEYQPVITTNDPPVFALICRLLIDKGVQEFVDAASMVKAQGCHVKMVIVGSIDDNPKSVKSTDLERWVEGGALEYWGFSDNVANTLDKVDVVVLPSYREGLPKVLIEAASAGKAVITTDVPGCRDAIDVGRSGLLVPVKDAAALAKAISRLASNTEERVSMGQRGRNFAESEFGIEKVVDKHLRVYNEARMSLDGKR